MKRRFENILLLGRGGFVVQCLIAAALTFGFVHPAITRDTLTGEIFGNVIDRQTGGPVNGVTILFLNTANGRTRETRTTARGEYVLFQVEPGNYTLRAEAEGYSGIERKGILVPLNQPKLVIPVFGLRRIAAASFPGFRGRAITSLVSLRPPARVPPQATSTLIVDLGETSLVSLQDWALRSNFDSSIIATVPLRGGRTFDQLAMFAPGVARAPFSSGIGPAAGVGIGSVGQFAVHGLRSRSNNFTVDGSDNNDEDINVRRQGFVALVPQSAESVAEFQIMTAGFPAEFGRNSGSMVNAISLSGQNTPHGTIYGFINDDALNARNAFDTVFKDNINPPGLNGGGYSGKDSRHTQYGAAVGGPIAVDRVFYFLSGEVQRGHGTTLHHFVVPARSERGLRVSKTVNNGFIPIEDLADFFKERTSPQYSSAAGASIFSLYPAPNNSAGPFSDHNYSEAEPFEANSNAFSTKVDWLQSPIHAFLARYNFTHDHSRIPFTGDAINSAIGAATRVQNLSLFANSTKNLWGNALRISYGRTRLAFPPGEGKPLLFGSTPNGHDDPFEREVQTSYGHYGPFGNTGPIGQLSILPFSTIGVDVYNFPQGRVDNTFQASDFATIFRHGHLARAGFDIRYSQLNSFSDRNSRPLVVFGDGEVSEDCMVNPFCLFKTSNGRLNGTDLAALGAPSGFLQTLSTDPSADTTISLRLTQYDFFLHDDWKLRPNLTLNFGIRYEVQTTPHENHNRIEKTFGAVPSQFGHLATGDTPANQNIVASGNLAFDQALLALQQFLAGRQQIYAVDRNNFAPRIGFAWDPTRTGKTAIHAGLGIEYDANPGIFTSQSRNVFPTFVPLNLDLNFNPPNGTYINSPTFFRFAPTRTLLVKPGTLNVYNLGEKEFATGLGTLFNQQIANPEGNLAGNGLAFTLPEKNLRTAYARESLISVEHQFGSNWLLSAAYVQTLGRQLPRFTTPNGGLISTPFLVSSPTSSGNQLIILDLPPQYREKPNPALGAFTAMENAARSSYHGMQLSTMKRLNSDIQLRANWTWSHAIDELSDMFDMRGAFALPEDSRHPEADRASANFDVRHRITGFFVWNPRNWTAAVTGEFQTGQPYTINTIVDRNGDGNLTDRSLTIPNPTDANVTNLLHIGRNTERAAANHAIDAALARRFSISTGVTLEGRIEMFNVFNATSPGIPIRLAESPGFKTSFDTQVNPRSIRLAARLNF